jgi:excisionase family DNA binding protein
MPRISELQEAQKDYLAACETVKKTGPGTAGIKLIDDTMGKAITLGGENRLLTIDEVCGILEVKKCIVYILMREGKLPYYDLPKRKIGTEDLAEYIKSTRRTGGVKAP